MWLHAGSPDWMTWWCYQSHHVVTGIAFSRLILMFQEVQVRWKNKSGDMSKRVESMMTLVSLIAFLSMTSPQWTAISDMMSSACHCLHVFPKKLMSYCGLSYSFRMPVCHANDVECITGPHGHAGREQFNSAYSSTDIEHKSHAWRLLLPILLRCHALR